MRACPRAAGAAARAAPAAAVRAAAAAGGSNDRLRPTAATTTTGGNGDVDALLAVVGDIVAALLHNRHGQRDLRGDVLLLDALHQAHALGLVVRAQRLEEREKAKGERQSENGRVGDQRKRE